MVNRKYCNWLLLLVTIITICGLARPALAEPETVRVHGDQMRYSVAQDLLTVSGNVEVITKDVTIKATDITATYKDGQVTELKATGKVEIIKDGDTFYSTEFTYQVKNKVGFILEMNGTTTIQESGATAYLHGISANYHEEYIEIIDGDLTTCDLSKPHYLFKARKVEFYPGDKIKAWGLTFWEFNGRVPLMYWPYYVFSLKEKENERFTPQLGYNTTEGIFLKMTYRYDDFLGGHGELDGDIFQKVGPAIGFTHYYLDQGNNVGSLRAYLQYPGKEPTKTYLTVTNTFKNTFKDVVDVNSNTTWTRSMQFDNLVMNNSINYAQKTNYIKYENKYTGSINWFNTSNVRSDLSDTLRAKWKIGAVTTEGGLAHQLNLLDASKNFWNSDLRFYQSTTVYDWSAGVKKQSSDWRTSIYRLPDLDFKLRPGAISEGLRPYLSPFTYTFHGEYVVKTTSTTVDSVPQIDIKKSSKIVDRIDATKDIKLVGPLSTILTGYGSAKNFSTGEALYEYGGAVDLQTKPINSFSGNVKYTYSDFTSEHQLDKDSLVVRENPQTSSQLSGGLSYSKNGLRVSTGTSYNLGNNPPNNKRWGLLNNSIAYNWDRNSAQLTVPVDLESKKIGESSSIVRLNMNEKLNLEFNGRYSSNVNNNRLGVTLDWQINDAWHINLETAFNPMIQFDPKASSNKGKVQVIRDLHCRTVSLSYDVTTGTVWFEYQIKAFPKEKVRVGGSKENPIQLDLNLGGNS